jgi:hypothetical protein
MSENDLLQAADTLEAEAERLEHTPEPEADPKEPESVLKDAKKHLDTLREIAGESASQP